jgi:hypothetical protein
VILSFANKIVYFRGISFAIDNERILFPDGLRIDGSNPNSSPDARKYYSYLLSRQLTDAPFDKMFPPLPAIGLRQAFCLDVSSFNITDSSEFSLEITWGNTGAPANWNVISMALIDAQLRKKQTDAYFSATKPLFN